MTIRHGLSWHSLRSNQYQLLTGLNIAIILYFYISKAYKFICTLPLNPPLNTYCIVETSSQLYMNCYWSGLKSYARSKEQSVWTDTWMTFLLHFLKLSRYGNTSLRFFILVCWVFLPYAMFLHRYPHFILWYECNIRKKCRSFLKDTLIDDSDVTRETWRSLVSSQSYVECLIRKAMIFVYCTKSIQ